MTHLNAVILSLAMGLCCHCWHSSMNTLSFQCCEMRHGHCQTSAGASRSLCLSRLDFLVKFLGIYVLFISFFLTLVANIWFLLFSMTRQSLHFQLLSALYIQMMMKSSQMLAGLYHICQMVPMTKSKLLLRPMSAPG